MQTSSLPPHRAPLRRTLSLPARPPAAQETRATGESLFPSRPLLTRTASVYTSSRRDSVCSVSSAAGSNNKNIELLFSHGDARVVSFSVTGGSGAGSGRLSPWRSPVERTIASGPLRIYKTVPHGIAFLQSGSALRPVLAKTRCWNVDGRTRFVLQLRPGSYWRVDLFETGIGSADNAAADLRSVLATIAAYEVTACPFEREGGPVAENREALEPSRVWRRSTLRSGQIPIGLQALVVDEYENGMAEDGEMVGPKNERRPDHEDHTQVVGAYDGPVGPMVEDTKGERKQETHNEVAAEEPKGQTSNAEATVEQLPEETILEQKTGTQDAARARLLPAFESPVKARSGTKNANIESCVLVTPFPFSLPSPPASLATGEGNHWRQLTPPDSPTVRPRNHRKPSPPPATAQGPPSPETPVHSAVALSTAWQSSTPSAETRMSQRRYGQNQELHTLPSSTSSPLPGTYPSMRPDTPPPSACASPVDSSTDSDTTDTHITIALTSNFSSPSRSSSPGSSPSRMSPASIVHLMCRGLTLVSGALNVLALRPGGLLMAMIFSITARIMSRAFASAKYTLWRWQEAMLSLGQGDEGVNDDEDGEEWLWM